MPAAVFKHLSAREVLCLLRKKHDLAGKTSLRAVRSAAGASAPSDEGKTLPSGEKRWHGASRDGERGGRCHA